MKQPKYYTPRQIAEQGLITNSVGSDNIESNYVFVLNLIKAGRLKASNISLGSKLSNYMVSDESISEYHKQFAKGAF